MNRTFLSQVFTIILSFSVVNGALSSLHFPMKDSRQEKKAEPAAAVPDTKKDVSVWLTEKDESKLLERQAGADFQEEKKDGRYTIAVDDKKTFQEMDGFGASITSSSAYLIHKKLPEEERSRLMKELFGDQGIGISFIRMPMGATDFSIKNYTYDDLAAGETDPDMSEFSIDKDREDVLPVTKQAKAENSSLKIFASPWTAPAWMKTSGFLNGGSLKKEYYQAYADYFVKFAKAYEKEGLPIYAVTAQNEPGHQTPTYPTMKMDWTEQADFIGNYLGPAFEKNGIPAKIAAWDHNWDSPWYPENVLADKKASKYIAGTAFHCYGGEVSSQTEVQKAYPKKGIWFTECSGGSWSTSFGDNLKWNMSNLIIGATRNWAKSVILWNVALDENNGPQNGGCPICRGVVTVDKHDGTYDKNVEYYALGHISKFVKPGAVRIGSNMTDKLQNVAFKNPDGSIALIVFNNTESTKKFDVSYHGKAFSYSLPGGAAATYTWKP
ncbi:glycosyl hydrolase [Metabacillus sp. GX 13764]|uniref:glycoside hydrolase family 30 protein n=1 Tax=Metabacillus kandeliae TaxID=2900151 RepID=UPI001E2A51CF|nr:glycoside hydrolase family 30 beta sandwich domain-containing protein [Metabacillus kandeliae]MCD7035064.1 glycosyl hydrolase [Metabacillus kandeliae]